MHLPTRRKALDSLRCCLLGSKFNVSKSTGVDTSQGERGRQTSALEHWHQWQTISERATLGNSQKGHCLPFHKMVEQTLTVGNSCREKPILTPCWNCFFDLLFVVFIIIIIHNELPQRILPFCLTVKLEVSFFRTLSTCRRQEGRNEHILCLKLAMGSLRVGHD